MIGTFFLSILAAFLGLLLGFLPTGTLPPEIAAAFNSIWGMVNAFSYVIAVDTLIQVASLVLAFDLIVMLWHIIQWIIRKVPGMQ